MRLSANCFGGDLISMGIVFSATITGFYLKQQMQAKKINHYVVFIVSAFVASLCASTALIFDTTSEIACNQRALSCAWGAFD